MVVPLIYAGVMIGRFAIPVIARYVIKHGVKKAGVKFGKTIVKNAKVIKQVKQLKTITKTTTKAAVKGPRGKIISKAKPKVKFKPTSKKQIAIQKKIKAKPSKKAFTKGIDYTYKAGTKKVKKLPSKKIKIAKTQKKLITKAVKDKIITKADAKKILKTKVSKKPIKKPTKVTTATKSTKVKTKPSKKPTKKPTKKPDKKVTAKKPVTTAVKPKPKFKPGFVTGLTVGGAVPYIYSLLTKKKDKDKIVPKPKPDAPVKKSIGGTGRGEGALEFARRSKDAAIAKMKEKESRESRKLYQTARPSATFEARVRALVAQKDKLKNVEAGDGRSEYQVRMHKLKQENKKDWKKLFTIGGKLK